MPSCTFSGTSRHYCRTHWDLGVPEDKDYFGTIVPVCKHGDVASWAWIRMVRPSSHRNYLSHSAHDKHIEEARDAETHGGNEEYKETVRVRGGIAVVVITMVN